VAVHDENVPIRGDDDIGWLIERIGTIAGNARLAERHDDLPFGAELEDLVALAWLALGVSNPHVALAIDRDAVWLQ
jgi:hypothetical protein